jgi:hypothetical protein
MAIIHLSINPMIKFVILGLITSLAPAYAAAGPLASSGSIALGELAESSDINNIAVSQDGARACVVASYIMERDGAIHSTVTLVDLVRKQTGWTRQITPPGGTANVYAKACRFHGNKLYALANADSSSAMANNQGRVYVYAFTADGKARGHAAVPVPAESRVAIDLLLHGGKLHVVGYGKDADAYNEYYSMFDATFDTTLDFQTRVTKDGSYTQFSAARSVGDHLYIGGEFFPRRVAGTDLPIDYANSKIKPGGGYRWSVRPHHTLFTASDNIATAINDRATTFSLSQSKGMSSIIAVDANGKMAPAKTFKSNFCKVQSLSHAGSGLMAIRQSCAGSNSPRGLVWIDPAAGTETPLILLGDTPKFIMSSGGNWYGVNSNGRKLALVVGKLEERQWLSLESLDRLHP